MLGLLFHRARNVGMRHQAEPIHLRKESDSACSPCISQRAGMGWNRPVVRPTARQGSSSWTEARDTGLQRRAYHALNGEGGPCPHVRSHLNASVRKLAE